MIELIGFVEFVDYRRFQWKLHRAADVLSEMCHWAALNGAMAGVAAVKKSPPFISRTKRLVKSGRWKSLVRMRSFSTAEMRWATRYASFVDKGTKAHDIRPKLFGEGPLRGKNTRFDTKKQQLFGRATGKRRREGEAERTHLRWMGSDGQWRFARMVRHPGSDPFDFSTVAQDAAVTAALHAIEHHLREVDRIFHG